MVEMTYEEWQAKGKALFGPDMNDWRFVCPACGHVASVRDWRETGAGKAVAFSCIGRFLNDGPVREAFVGGKKKTPGPCNYAGGGLIGLNPVRVICADDYKHDVFAFYEEQES